MSNATKSAAIVTSSNSNTVEEAGKSGQTAVVRPLHTLEAQLVYNGETVKGAGNLTLQEGIRLGVALVIRGEESKARGVYVLADKARSLKGDDLASFMGALKSELVNESVSRVTALLPADMGEKAREKAKKEAQAVGERRYDNLGQTLRAAKFALENPRAIANGVSVFTIQQGLAYAKKPTLGEGEEETKEGQIKLECHKVVSKLLNTPGTSQGALKEAIKKAKETVEKKHEKVDNRTEAQKAQEARVSRMAQLPARVAVIVKDIDELAKDSAVKPGEWRSAALENSVRDLARLAGLVIVEKPAVEVNK